MNGEKKLFKNRIPEFGVGLVPTDEANDAKLLEEHQKATWSWEA